MPEPTDVRHTDIAVVGLGLIGSGALRALAADGVDCVGIGPGEPADWSTHQGPFASHYDSGRITRHLDPRYEWALLAARAIAGYAQLEADSGIEFHRPVGVVLAELDEARIEAITAVARQLGVATHSFLDERLSFPDGPTLLSEPAPAGHVDPRRMLAANLAAASNDGATIVRLAAVQLDEVAGGGWLVRAANGAEVHAERVLAATGAHSDEIATLRHLGCPPFAVRGEVIVMATLGSAEQERLAGIPSVLARLADTEYADVYMVPPTDYPDGTVRLKMGATLRSRRWLDDGDARRAWMAGDAHTDEMPTMRALLEGLVPGLVADRWETKPCLITDTASGVPVVDHLAPGLVLAAGGNGFAAKSANAIGALAARLAVDGRWTDTELDQRVFAATRLDPRPHGHESGSAEAQ